VVRIREGRARIVEFRSVLDWWDRHGDILKNHMRAYGQMWDQRLDQQTVIARSSAGHKPLVRS